MAKKVGSSKLTKYQIGGPVAPAPVVKGRKVGKSKGKAKPSVQAMGAPSPAMGPMMKKGGSVKKSSKKK